MERFYLPTEILSGRGAIDQLGTVAARFGRHVMIVCSGGSVRRSGLLDRAIDLLEQQGLRVTLFDQVSGEADLSTVAQGIALGREAQCELLVGLGGGSAIDTAKAIAGMISLPGSVTEYHNGRPLEEPARPFIAVPTTAGTGAEVTKNAVLINRDTRLKTSIRDDSWFARAAIVDPELTCSMPPDVTASTGSDALCQAIESFTSIGASPVTDALAMRAIALIAESLERAYVDGQDMSAREGMSMGSLMAGMAMANARLGGVHGMAHPLGSYYDIPHGVVCGLLLPYTMAYNLEYAIDKYATIASLMGEEIDSLTGKEAAQRAVEQVRALLERIHIPQHLSAFGVRADQLDPIIAESLPSGSLKHNPRPLAAEDVRHILEMAL